MDSGPGAASRGASHPGRGPGWLPLAAGMVLAAVTVAWVLADRLFLTRDADHHHVISLIYVHAWRGYGLPGVWDVLRTTNVAWPPLIHLYTGLLSWLGSEELRQVKLTSLGLLPLILWGSYSLGRRLQDAVTGALGATLAAFSIGLSYALREVSIDLMTTTVVVWALVALLHAGDLSRPRAALALGLACGLALLARVQAAFFLAGPALLLLGGALARAPDGRQRARRLLNLGLAVSLALLVSSPYWFGRLGQLASLSRDHLDPQRVRSWADPSFLGGVLYYGPALARAAGWGVTLVALLGLPLTWRQRPVQLLALSVLGGMLGYALTVSREPRYLLPAIPMLALLACLGLRRLCRGRRGGWFGPASSALLLASALPTLLATGFLPQLRPGEVLARVVEASYTRRPEPEGETAVSGPAAAGLAAVLGDDASGEGAYLLFAGDHQQMLAMELAPRAPRALFTTRQFDHLVFSPRNRAQQRRRRLLLVTDNLPRPYRLLWQTRLPGDHLRIYQLSSWREVLPALE